MPARTVVFTDTKKHDGERLRPLLASEYTQVSSCTDPGSVFGPSISIFKYKTKNQRVSGIRLAGFADGRAGRAARH